jgi:hypothetical protein
MYHYLILDSTFIYIYLEALLYASTLLNVRKIWYLPTTILSTWDTLFSYTSRRNKKVSEDIKSQISHLSK